MVLVFVQWVLVLNAVQDPLPTSDRAVDGTASWMATLATDKLVWFMITQISTGLIIRAFYRALSDDWAVAVSQSEERRRTILYVLASAPVAGMLLPSFASDRLWPGVLMQLAMLALAWRWLPDIMPSGTVAIVRGLARRVIPGGAHVPPTAPGASA